MRVSSAATRSGGPRARRRRFSPPFTSRWARGGGQLSLYKAIHCLALHQVLIVQTQALGLHRRRLPPSPSGRSGVPLTRAGRFLKAQPRLAGRFWPGEASGRRTASRRFPVPRAGPAGILRQAGCGKSSAVGASPRAHAGRGSYPAYPLPPCPAPRRCRSPGRLQQERAAGLKVFQLARSGEHESQPVLRRHAPEEPVFSGCLRLGRFEDAEKPAPEPGMLPSFLRRQQLQELFGHLFGKS